MKAQSVDETEGPKGTIPPQLPGESTMEAPELGALEREAKRLLKTGPFGPILEVGIFHGRSTAILAQTGAFVVAVDWLKGNVELAPPDRRGDTGWSRDEQLRALIPNLSLVPGQRERILVIEGSSFDVLPMLGFNRFSMILLDGDKREASVYEDLKWCWTLLQDGGTLFLDDWFAATHDEPVGTVDRAWRRFAAEKGLDLDVDWIGFQPPTYGETPKLGRIRKP